jgi:hypothetical protein
MKGLAIAAMVACVSCVAPLDEEPEVDGSTTGAPQSDDPRLDLPPCVALSETIHPVFYKACASWSDFPIAAVCSTEPTADRCWKFDRAQRYDGYYCCCDPRIDETCDPYH